MKLTEEIIKSAMLGTDKYFPQYLSESHDFFAKIAAEETEKEVRFLRLAAAAFIYEEAGEAGLHLPVALPPCPEEKRPVIDTATTSHFEAALQEKDNVLLFYLIHRCHIRQRVVSSGLVTRMLDKALEHKKKAEALIQVCGETGAWLCRINPRWQELTPVPEEGNIWETGSPEARKTFFKELRKANPAEATALLSATLQEESAAVRAEFIAMLEAGLSAADEAFLTQCLSDKSVKVKQIALFLLKKLPGSALNRLYLDYALRVITLAEEKQFLISRKKTLKFHKNLPPGEELFTSGIEKVSNQKGVQDAVFWLGQTLAFVQPSELAGKLGCTEKELLDLLLSHKEHAVLLPYLIEASLHFRHQGWASQLLEHKEVQDLRLVQLLPESERAPYYEHFVSTHLDALFAILCDDSYTPIAPRLAKQILKHLQKQPYALTHQQYRSLTLHLPLDLLPALNDYVREHQEEPNYRYSRSQYLELIRILEFRKNLTN
ncbi:MAG: hypothetical protein EAZ89_17090 [Bacteroidetes bacterium]|nr:MAG: hypothetical protein EAZ89_17090 [Bacteroidota bacterium]